MILVIAYLVFVLVGVAILIYTKDVDEEFYDEPPVENVIGDAYLYAFVESDFERVERELIRFADEIAHERIAA